MLPAAHGDAILLEWGDASAPHRMLVDGGPYFTYEEIRARLVTMLGTRRFIDILVITHIDADHLEGVIRILQDRQLGVRFGDIWFNDISKIRTIPDDQLGAIHGEFLGALIERDELPWNQAFDGGAVVLEADDEPRRLEPIAGLEITLLSPGPSRLRELGKDWEKVLRRIHFIPGSREQALEQLAKRAKYEPPSDQLGTSPDRSKANGSSIAFLATYEGKQVLLTGDAFPQSLEAAIEKLGAPPKVAAFKLSHHGSFSSTSRKLLEMVPAERYLISTNGKSSANHPDKLTLDLIQAATPSETTPRVLFNYQGKNVDPWIKAADRGEIEIAFVPGTPIDL